MSEYRYLYRIIGVGIFVLAVLAGRVLTNLTRKRDPNERDPEWMGDAVGRRRRLLIILVVLSVLLGAGLFALSFQR